MHDPGAIRKQARSLLKDLHASLKQQMNRNITYKDFYPVNVRLALDLLGWQLRELHNLDQRARCDFREKIIFLDLSIGEAERSFSLAHEIGHAVLHERVVTCYGGVLHRDHRPKSVRRGSGRSVDSGLAAVESDANQFAVELLMPEEAVRNHFRRVFGFGRLRASSAEIQQFIRLGIGAPIHQVATDLSQFKPPGETLRLIEQFGVSKPAMARRLVELELLTA